MSSPWLFCLTKHHLPVLSPPGPHSPGLPTSAPPACAGQPPAPGSLWAHRLPGSAPPDAVLAAPGPAAPRPAAAPPAAAAPRPAADFLGREEGKSGGVGEVCREQKPHGGPGVGRGLRGPRRRDFHSPESQGPREWDLSWKSNWMEAASGSSALGPSSGFLSSSWKPSAYSSQWCAPTLTVFSLVELGTHTRDLTFPLQSSFP